MSRARLDSRAWSLRKRRSLGCWRSHEVPARDGTRPQDSVPASVWSWELEALHMKCTCPAASGRSSVRGKPLARVRGDSKPARKQGEAERDLGRQGNLPRTAGVRDPQRQAGGVDPDSLLTLRPRIPAGGSLPPTHTPALRRSSGSGPLSRARCGGPGGQGGRPRVPPAPAPPPPAPRADKSGSREGAARPREGQAGRRAGGQAGAADAGGRLPGRTNARRAASRGTLRGWGRGRGRARPSRPGRGAPGRVGTGGHPRAAAPHPRAPSPRRGSGSPRKRRPRRARVEPSRAAQGRPGWRNKGPLPRGVRSPGSRGRRPRPCPTRAAPGPARPVHSSAAHLALDFHRAAVVQAQALGAVEAPVHGSERTRAPGPRSRSRSSLAGKGLQKDAGGRAPGPAPARARPAAPPPREPSAESRGPRRAGRAPGDSGGRARDEREERGGTRGHAPGKTPPTTRPLPPPITPRVGQSRPSPPRKPRPAPGHAHHGATLTQASPAGQPTGPRPRPATPRL